LRRGRLNVHLYDDEYIEVVINRADEVLTFIIDQSDIHYLRDIFTPLITDIADSKKKISIINNNTYNSIKTCNKLILNNNEKKVYFDKNINTILIRRKK
jgi:hypothetical protein